MWVSLFGIVLKGLGVLLAFASQMVLARVLGVEDYGVYVTVVACATVLSLLGGFGMPLASVRFLATYAEQRDWPQYRGFLRTAVGLTVMSSVLIGAVVLTIFAVVPALRPIWPAMLAGVPLIFLLSASGLATGTYLAEQRPLLAEVIGNVSRPILVMTLIGGVIWSGQALGARFALLLTVLAGMVVLSFQFAGLRATLAAHWRGVSDTAEFRPWLASGLAFVMSTAAYSMMERVDTILLSTMVSPAAAAPYNVAARLALLVGVALAPVSALLGPMGAQLLTRGDLRGLQRVLGQGVLLSTGLGACLATGLLLFAPFLLGLFGKEFRAGQDVLLVLVCAQVVLAMVGPAGYILAVAGHNRLLVAVSIATAGLDLALCVVLIPRMGAMGAAVATAMSISSNGLALAVITWWKVKVDTTLVGGVGLLFRSRERLA